MPIIALEGAPGVGKTTWSRTLLHSGGAAVVIPEVNLLFTRPHPEPRHWYLQRQLDRYAQAAQASAAGQLAVLDGDPFQPLWFNWAFAEEGWNWREAADFYRDALAANQLAWPDRYLFLHAPEAVRQQRLLERERATGRGEARAQAKNARYARLVAPQRRYFEALVTRYPGWVTLLDMEHGLPRLPPASGVGKVNSGEALDFAAAWLAANFSA